MHKGNGCEAMAHLMCSRKGKETRGAEVDEGRARERREGCLIGYRTWAFTLNELGSIPKIWAVL